MYVIHLLYFNHSFVFESTTRHEKEANINIEK